MKFSKVATLLMVAVIAIGASCPAAQQTPVAPQHQVLQKSVPSTQVGQLEAQPNHQGASGRLAPIAGTKANQKTGDLPSFIAAENAFSLRVISALSAKQQGNFVVSPFGAFELLNQLKVSVDAESEAEIANSLGLKSNQSFVAPLQLIRKSLLPFPAAVSPRDGLPASTGSVPNKPSPTLAPFVSQNVMLIGEGLALRDGVKEQVVDPFGAAMIGVNWTDSESRANAAKQVAQVFSEATSGRLAELSYTATEQNPKSMAMLNLAYFEASWSKQFSSGLTAAAPFFLGGQQVQNKGLVKVETQFMHASKRMSFYHDCETFQAVELPYQNSTIAMVLVLPARGKTDLEVLEAIATSKCLGPRAQRPQAGASVNLKIPKFKFRTTDIDLSGICQAMGIKRIFGTPCGLELLFKNADYPMFVGTAKQSAFIEVNEAGTKAAAITGVTMVPLSRVPDAESVKTFNADRPFFFFLADVHGAIYFGGRINNPNQ